MTRLALPLALLSVACVNEVDLAESALSADARGEVRAGEICGDLIDNDRDGLVDEGCRTASTSFKRSYSTTTKFVMTGKGGAVDMPNPLDDDTGGGDDPNGPWTSFPQYATAGQPTAYLLEAPAIRDLGRAPVSSLASTTVYAHTSGLDAEAGAQASGNLTGGRSLGANFVQGLPGADVIAVYANPEERVSTDEADVWIRGERGTDFGTSFVVLDLDDDGIDDLIAAVPGEDLAVVLYGPLRGDLEVGDADFAIRGAGQAIHRAGDFDGDGVGDLLLEGAEGMAVLAGGRRSDGRIDAAELPLHIDFGRYGRPDAVAGDFDLSNDGLADIALTYARYSAAIVWDGGTRGSLTSTSGYYALIQTGSGDGFGTSLAGGDIDGDGDNELLVGAPYGSHFNDEDGAVYAFPQLSAGRHSGHNGTAIVGATGGEQIGMRVVTADYDGDAHDEVFITGARTMTLAWSNQPKYVDLGGLINFNIGYTATRATY
ncbi:MAG: FG-GAP repeat protein [Proteobacteria bacterium]|nr:FG-GAP repeat protein [Pseudomonadota bacterium]